MGGKGHCVNFITHIELWHITDILSQINSNYLTSLLGSKEEPRQTNIFSLDMAIQTENIVIGAAIRPIYVEADEGNSQEDRNNEAANQLSSSDLSAILKWSSDISSDMNLFSGAQCTGVYY